MHRGPTEMPTPNASQFGRWQSMAHASPAMDAAQPDFGPHHGLEPEAVNPTVVAARADRRHRAKERSRPVRRERWKNSLSTPGCFGGQAGIGAVTALFDLASRTRLLHAGCAKSPGAAPPGRLKRRRSPYRRAAFSCAMDLESDNERLTVKAGARHKSDAAARSGAATWPCHPGPPFSALRRERAAGRRLASSRCPPAFRTTHAIEHRWHQARPGPAATRERTAHR